MKRLEFGFFLFFVTLVVGAWASGYFSEQRVIVETTKVSLSVENVVNVQTTAKEQNTPEFTNVSIPNEYENGDFHSFVPVLKGEASLGQCEVSAESKRPWLGLYKRGAKYSLEAANVRFGNRQTDDFGVWIPMRFRDSRNALFLFGHDDSIQPGPVTTLYEMPYGGDDESLIGDEFRKDFSIGDRIYTLRVAKGASQTNNSVLLAVLEADGKRDILYFRDESGVNFGRFEWVGDLDNDNKLDILFSFFAVNGGGQRFILFLSSAAKGNHLVQPYAFFDTRFRGC